MSKSVMKTAHFELTGEMVEFIKVNTEQWAYDDRMDMIIPRANLEYKILLYKNYIKSFCETINMDHQCRPAYMTACGFLPVGVEPTVMCGMINKEFIIPMLRDAGIDYFLMKPTSPVKASYEPIGAMATSHDVWVNKMDLTALVNKPAHNITTLNVLEALGL